MIKWTGFSFGTESSGVSFLLIHYNHVMNENSRNILLIIWIATIWNI